mgnify:CR=1 FL=1
MWLYKHPDKQNGFSGKRRVTFLFALVGSGLLLAPADQLISLRVNYSEETGGLDLVFQGERGYYLQIT